MSSADKPPGDHPSRLVSFHSSDFVFPRVGGAATGQIEPRDSFKLHTKPLIIMEEDDDDEDRVRIGGPGPNDSVDTLDMMRNRNKAEGMTRLEMFESLEITEEEPNNSMSQQPKTDEKGAQESLLRRFDMCFNDVEKSEILSILTS